jgi:hypothetical protein
MDNFGAVANHLDVTFLETTPTGDHQQILCYRLDMNILRVTQLLP